MDSPASPYRLVLTTSGSEEEAESIARGLVDRRLAACVNVVRGARSFYRWEGKIACDDEWLLLVKTNTTLLDRVRTTIRELHSYTLPEMIAIPIDDGDPEYLAWLGASLGD